MEWFVALRYLRGKRRVQFISLIAYISAAGVFLGSFVLVVALSIANGFEKEVRDRIIGIFAHARVTQYYSRPITNPDSLRQVILFKPGISACAPFVSGKGSVECDGIQEGVLIMGVDDSLESAVTDLGSTIKIGAFNLDSNESKRGRRFPGILIGSGLAEKLGALVGTEIVLGTVSAVAENEDPLSHIRAGRYTVAGVFETGLYEYDLNLVYISVQSAQLLFDQLGVEGMQIKTNDVFNADKISTNLIASLGGYPYKAIDWKNQNKALFKWMKLEQLIIFVVISLIIIVAAFNILCSLFMMILEKRREIGILMGMGTQSKSIMKIFMFNGIIIGFFGSTLGVLSGLALCLIQAKWHLIPLPGDVYFITTLPVLINGWNIIAIFVASNVICFCATLYPAWLASRILPAESFRME